MDHTDSDCVYKIKLWITQTNICVSLTHNPTLFHVGRCQDSPGVVPPVVVQVQSPAVGGGVCGCAAAAGTLQGESGRLEDLVARGLLVEHRPRQRPVNEKLLSMKTGMGETATFGET